MLVWGGNPEEPQASETNDSLIPSVQDGNRVSVLYGLEAFWES